MNNYISNREKKSFRDIVLSHLAKVLEISTHEFRGGYWQTKTRIAGASTLTDHFYVTNVRKEYIQAVQSLADVLLPFFDKEMKKDYESIMKKFNDASKEPKEKKGEEEGEDKGVLERLGLSQKLFQKLNLLLHRTDYLKGSIYSESDLEDESEPIDTDKK